MIRTIVILLAAFATYSTVAQGYTVSGYISDMTNGETLIGATVMLKGSIKGTVTDKNGYFRISGIKSGMNTLEISHIGYIKKEITVEIKNKDFLLPETYLEPDLISIREVSVVEVKPEEVGDKEIETSQLQLTPKTIQSIPSARNDIFRAIKYLPGIESTEPFSPLYSARGGDPGENRVIMDGVTIYNPYHYSSSAGIFNVKTIKSVDLLVGGFGAEFGGTNSSILYLITKDGNTNKPEIEFEPSLIETKGVVEFPLNDHSAMMIAGRYFYDLPSSFMMYANSFFYDLNLSYFNKINNRNRLNIKLFSSKDNNNYQFGRFFSYLSNSFDLDFYEDFDMSFRNNWSNFAGTAILKSILSPKIFLRTQVYASIHSSNNISGLDFNFDVEEDGESEHVKLHYNTLFKSRIQDLSGKSVLNAKLNAANTVQAGIEFNTYQFRNSANINDFEQGDNTRNPTLLAAFIEDKIKLGPLIMRPGIRFSKYQYSGSVYTEPRLNVNWNINQDSKIKAAWGIYYQYVISMNTQEFEVSQFLDYYYPLKKFEPSKSLHYIIGFEKNLFNTSNISLDLYYKDIQRTYMFDLNQSEQEAYTFSDKLQQGKGKAYGLEVMWKGSWQKLSGWISYGLARSVRSYPHIMNGEKFLFDYDRTHSLNTLINYHHSQDLSYSTTFIMLTGSPRTIETIMQSYYYYEPLTNQLSFYPMFVTQGKNNARLPMVTELDVGVKKKLRRGFGAELAAFLKADESYLSLTVGNILFFRRNVLWYFSTGTDKYIPVGINYIPYVNAGFSIKF